MASAGPELALLLHRLAECPSDFLLKPGEIDVVALACDHARALGLTIPNAERRRELVKLPVELQRLIAIVLWLLRDEWFLTRPELGEASWEFLQSDPLAKFANLVKAETVINDPDRREELIRLCLRALGVMPRGETAVQAADRLTTLDSVERQRVIRATRSAEARTREIREAMAKKRAEEAAARYAPE